MEPTGYTELLTEFNSKQADLNSRRIVCRIDGKRYAAALWINALHSAPACRNWNKSPAFVGPFVCHEDFAVCNARSTTCLCRSEYLPSSDLNRGYGISSPDKANDTVGVSTVENVAVFHILHGDVDIFQHLAIKQKSNRHIPRVAHVYRATARPKQESIANKARNNHFLIGTVSRCCRCVHTDYEPFGDAMHGPRLSALDLTINKGFRGYGITPRRSARSPALAPMRKSCVSAEGNIARLC